MFCFNDETDFHFRLLKTTQKELNSESKQHEVTLSSLQQVDFIYSTGVAANTNSACAEGGQPTGQAWHKSPVLGKALRVWCLGFAVVNHLLSLTPKHQHWESITGSLFGRSLFCSTSRLLVSPRPRAQKCVPRTASRR